MKLDSFECARIISGLLGSLIQNSDYDTVRDAIRQLNANEPLWAAIRGMVEDVNAAIDKGTVMENGAAIVIDNLSKAKKRNMQ